MFGARRGHAHAAHDAAATPQFFQSTKFFAVLDVEEARELFSATNKVRRHAWPALTSHSRRSAQRTPASNPSQERTLQRVVYHDSGACARAPGLSVLARVVSMAREPQVTLKPREVLFRAGDSSEAGIFIVVSGQLGVFLNTSGSVPPIHTNTLRCV